jgi:hypothetical protein
MTTVQAGSPSASGNYYHDDGGNVSVSDYSQISNSATRLYTISGVSSGLTMATTNATLTHGDTPYFAADATVTLTVDDADKSITAFTVTADTTVSGTLKAVSGETGTVNWTLTDEDNNGTYETLTVGDLTYEIASDQTAEIVGCNSSATTLHIPARPLQAAPT